jgi:hypothetical protein
VLAILELALTDSQNAARYRFFAYLLSAHSNEQPMAVTWLGRPVKMPDWLNPDEAHKTMSLLSQLWLPSENTSEIRKELAQRIEQVARMGKWQKTDLPLLFQVRDALRAANYETSATSGAILRLKIGWALSWLGWATLAHLGFWAVLVTIYPHSPRIQAVVFWNPWVRQLFGLLYVGLLIVYVPFLRARMFAPFRSNLIEDAQLSEDTSDLVGKLEHYYTETLVEFSEPRQHESRQERVVEAIPELCGHVVLEGESGLGKTMFIRWLVQRSSRLVAYLPAERCNKGVLTALQDKLQGIARDEGFLEAIIYSGGLDLCIDGLNEVSAETRAAINLFVRRHPHTNILIATQPLLDWQAPARTYQLLPLERKQIEEFLCSRAAALGSTTLVQGSDYVERCQAFVAATLREDQPAELLQAAHIVLSNPMDLTIVSHMLAEGQQPDLLRLQEQQYGLVARRFQRAERRSFPLEAFSKQVYEMRLRDERALPNDKFGLEIVVLAQQKMVLKRYIMTPAGDNHVEWVFRHDKILEFFKLQTFLSPGSNLAIRHLDDPRFRGVYYLMAMQMPLEAAALLQRNLVLRAAETNDHSVSDRFVQLLESRRRAALPAPVWAERYTLPKVRLMTEEVERLTGEHEQSTARLERARQVLERVRGLSRMLFEPADDSLAGLVMDALIELGITAERLSEHGRVLGFRDAAGRAWRWAAITSPQAVTAREVDEALAEINSYPAGESPDAKHVLVVNTSPASPPGERNEYLAEADEAAKGKRAALLTAEGFLRAIDAIQRGDCTLEEFFQQLRVSDDPL